MLVNRPANACKETCSLVHMCAHIAAYVCAYSRRAHMCARTLGAQSSGAAAGRIVYEALIVYAALSY
jgi:hypothetical protein